MNQTEKQKQLEEQIKIESKRNIAKRQANGEYVEVSDIFDEADEIGEMLERTMGSKRFNEALKKVADEREDQN